MNPSDRRTRNVIGVPIDVIDWDQAVERISAWSQAGDSRVVCICNVHSVVTASQDTELAEVFRHADMATPDGAPIAWMLRRLSEKNQVRINGPDLMIRYCEYAARSDQSIYLYGASTETLNLLKVRLGKIQKLRIAGSYSPPFRPLTESEDDAVVSAINRSGAGVVWVGLGCPKQEKWMHEHRGRIQAVMIGVGAAFDYHAGTVQRAPLWMQGNGLEWLHRLISEPKRLWRRYFVTNTLFLVYATRQLICSKAAITQ